MKAALLPVVCEIFADSASHAAALAGIAQTCAGDLAQPLQLELNAGRSTPRRRPSRALSLSRAPVDPVITLRLPAELAAGQHPVWCLACRLACFCPEARVSVLVLGTHAFPPGPDPASDAAALRACA